MAPPVASTSSTPYAIKSSTKLSLLAELNKRKGETARDTQSQGSTQSYTQAPKRSGQQQKKWKTNKGILQRMAADEAAVDLDGATSSPYARQNILIQKAKLYEKLRKGDTAGLTAGQKASLNVDFEAKVQQEWDDLDRDESRKVPKRPESESESQEDSEDEGPQPLKSNGEDNMVEIQDEFGRARMVPKHLASKLDRRPSTPPPEPNLEVGIEVDENNVFYGEQMEFPVYEPTPEELQARHRELGTEEPILQHYDSTREVRTKGASHFTFSKDEATRQAQMESIKQGRAVAEREMAEERKERSAADQEKEDRKALLAEKKRKLLELRAAKSDRPAKIQKLD